MSKRHLKGLNKAQRKAVLHGSGHRQMIDRPLLVIAGAGSGKTRVIAARVAELLCSGVPAERILLLTFSRKAASEMINRVGGVGANSPGGRATQLPWAGTFHSIAGRLLRQYGDRIGLAPRFTILDRSDSQDLMGLVRQDLGLGEQDAMFPKKDTCLEIHSLAVNSVTSVERILRTRYPKDRRWRRELHKLFAAYAAAKRKQNVLDYDDLLVLWADLLKEPKTASEIGALFDHVLVDEYQDTNRLQAKILLALKPDGRGVTVVGDDAQSIYSFRAATVHNILRFPKHFSPKARIIKLEQNYRSTQPVLTACNAVIALASERYEKELFSERKSAQKPFITTVNGSTEQAKYVADCVVEARELGVPLKSQAVLFRSSRHSGQLEIELAKRNISFVKWGGVKFLEAAHIKDALSVLRWCQNSGDRIAAVRALQLLPGIGPQTADTIFKEVAGNRFHKSLRSVVPPTAALKHWPAFVKTLADTRAERQPWPAEFEAICKWLGPHIRDKYDKQVELRLEDLEQLVVIAGSYESREAFLTELSIDPPDATDGKVRGADAPDDYLVLSTIHSAKGQEWRHVRILNVIEGCIPSRYSAKDPDEIEEERRLLYVAMTRAKDELDLVCPYQHFTHQQSSSRAMNCLARRSRFVPKDLNQYFDCRAWSARGRARLRDAKSQRKNGRKDRVSQGTERVSAH
jgi:DNA helicase II / ATP-dependent DNA helicase PcrA